MAPLNERLRFGSAYRPYPGETCCGDSWCVQWTSTDVCRVAVMDGAGHGCEAQRAAEVARDLLAERADLAPGPALVACHRALHGTRGAVMTVAAIDLAAGVIRTAGVGNVGTILLVGGREERFIPQRGMLGSNIPSIREVEFKIEREWMLALHTDGIRSQVSLPAAVSPGVSPDAIAESILLAHHREYDDALVVVVAAG